MSKLVEGLLSYLKNTTQDQFIKDWIEIESFNEIGPDISTFVQYAESLNRIEIDDLISDITYVNKSKKSEEYFGFFLS